MYEKKEHGTKHYLINVWKISTHVDLNCMHSNVYIIICRYICSYGHKNVIQNKVHTANGSFSQKEHTLPSKNIV